MRQRRQQKRWADSNPLRWQHELLRSLPQSLLVATHDLLLVKELLPRTIILDEGQVVADGETAALLADTTLLNKHGLELP